MSRLAGWLQGKLDGAGWSWRKGARETDISYTAFRAILTGETKVPGLESLDKLAKKFCTPLARLVELCDYDLGFKVPADRQQYVAQLIARQPEYQSVVEGLLALSQADFEAAAKHIEALRRMGGTDGQQSDQVGGTP